MHARLGAWAPAGAQASEPSSLSCLPAWRCVVLPAQLAGHPMQLPSRRPSYRFVQFVLPTTVHPFLTEPSPLRLPIRRTTIPGLLTQVPHICTSKAAIAAWSHASCKLFILVTSRTWGQVGQLGRQQRHRQQPPVNMRAGHLDEERLFLLLCCGCCRNRGWHCFPACWRALPARLPPSCLP